MKQISKNNFHQMCKDIKNHVEKNYDLPVKLSYDGTDYYQIEMAYCMAYGLYHLKSDIEIPNFQKWTNLKGEAINTNVKLNEIKEQCRRVYNHILNNKEAPSSVLVKADKNYLISTKVSIYSIAKTVVYYDTNQQLPLKTLYRSDAFTKPTPPKTYSEEIFDYFSSKFGKPTSIDNALIKIKGRGYGFYYDNRKTNKQTIDALATRGADKPNCTDVHQMLWHIGKVLGYDVRAVHVWCTTSNVGHVRLDFNKGDGWFHRDAAAVIDGECIECIWCGNGDVLGINSSWFMSNLNR